MRLEDIEKELYREGGQTVKKPEKKNGATPEVPSFETFPPEAPPVRPERPRLPRLSSLRPPRWTLWAGAGAVLLASLGFFIWWWFFSFPSSSVLLSVEGSEEARVGERQEIHIRYENRTRVPLADSRLILPLPEGVTTAGDPGLKRVERVLGTIGVGGSGQERFTLRFQGDPGSALELKPTLVFRPQNLSSSLERSTTFRVHLGPPILSLEISAPNEVLPGERFWLTLRYANLGTEMFDAVRVRMEVPAAFRILRIVPERIGTAPDWPLGSLASGESSEITMEGVLEGEERERKTIALEIGLMERGSFLVIAHAATNVSIASSPLLIAASVNDAPSIPALPGDELRFKITYKNNTTVSLREIIVKAELSGEMLDLASLRPGAAFFDSNARTLTWQGGNTPQLLALNPGESGEMAFEVKLLPNYELSSMAKRELAVLMRAHISSSSIPARLGVRELANQTEIRVPIASRVLLRSRITFRGGTVPLKVGEASTFRVRWEAVTFSNDITDVTIHTVLPEGVSWTGSVTGNFEEFGAQTPEFNERTQEITWSIPRLPAGSGITAQALTVSFDITARPSSQHVNRPMILLTETTIEGEDTFANVSVSSRTEPKDSALPDDPSWNPKNGEVRP